MFEKTHSVTDALKIKHSKPNSPEATPTQQRAMVQGQGTILGGNLTFQQDNGPKHMRPNKILFCRDQVKDQV